jgi:predicted nucleic acid-binding Zn ribbon protein
MKKRRCKYCKKLFEPARGNQLYCTRECYHKQKWVVRKAKLPPKEKRNCVVCGKEFEPNRWKQTTCLAKECQEIVRAKSKRKWFLQNKHKVNQKRSKGIVGSKRNCKLCGKEFIVNTGNKKYCSDICKQIVSNNTRDKQSAYYKMSQFSWKAKVNNINRNAKYTPTQKENEIFKMLNSGQNNLMEIAMQLQINYYSLRELLKRRGVIAKKFNEEYMAKKAIIKHNKKLERILNGN